jgi:hypothetical protein
MKLKRPTLFSVALLALFIGGLALVFNAIQLWMSRALITNVSSAYHDATPQILDNLQNANTEALTQQQLQDIINTAIKRVLDSSTQEKKPGLTFELLDCKLAVDWSYTGWLGKVTGGDINVCDVGAVVAAGIFACKAKKPAEFAQCVRAQLEAVKKAATAAKEAYKRAAAEKDANERERAAGERRAAAREAEILGRSATGERDALAREGEVGRGRAMGRGIR